MKQLAALWMVFNFVGCANPAPDTDICIVNAQAGQMACYNLSRDYDSSGRIKPSSTPFYKPAYTIQDLDKAVTTDLRGLENLKVFSKQIRAQLEECERAQ